MENVASGDRTWVEVVVVVVVFDEDALLPRGSK